jgi:hypothetical protein
VSLLHSPRTLFGHPPVLLDAEVLGLNPVAPGSVWHRVPPGQDWLAAVLLGTLPADSCAEQGDLFRSPVEGVTLGEIVRAAAHARAAARCGPGPLSTWRYYVRSVLGLPAEEIRLRAAEIETLAAMVALGLPVRRL